MHANGCLITEINTPKKKEHERKNSEAEAPEEKKSIRDFSGGPVFKTQLPLHRARVASLFPELRPPKLCNVKNKTKNVNIHESLGS